MQAFSLIAGHRIYHQGVEKLIAEARCSGYSMAIVFTDGTSTSIAGSTDVLVIQQADEANELRSAFGKEGEGY